MPRCTRPLLAFALAIGCGDDAPADGGSSTSTSGVDTSSSSGSSTGGGAPADTSIGTPPTDVGDDESTTTGGGGELHPSGRYVVTGWAQSKVLSLAVGTYDGGVVHELLPLAPVGELGTARSGYDVPAAGDRIAYCRYVPSLGSDRCFVRLVSDDALGDEQPFEVPSLADSTTIVSPRWAEGADAYVFAAVDTLGVAPTEVYRAGFVDGEVQLAELIVDAPAPKSSSLEVSADGTLLAYLGEAPDTTTNAFVKTISSDPGPGLQVSDLVDPALRVAATWFLGSDAIVYTVDEDNLAGSNAVYLSTLVAGEPEAPVVLGTPAVAPSTIKRVVPAPDGQGLVYWVGEGLAGDLLWVRIADGIPQPPTSIDPNVEAVYPGDMAWSDDARWLVYLRADPSTHPVRLIYMGGDEPSQPHAIGDDSMPTSVTTYFDAGRWLYVLADEGTAFRVDISGTEPGVPQPIALPEGGAPILTHLELSADGRRLAFAAATGDGDRRELWLVDVSGPVPGAPERISAPLDAGFSVGGGRFSADGELLLYEESEGESLEARVRLVDLTAPDEVPTIAEMVTGAEFIPG